jgi:16S rRNA (uracil1498-N3)-methyltransferase
VETRLRGAGVEKGRKRAREACKQSGNPWLPIIDEVTPLAVLGRLNAGVKWCLGDPSGAPLAAFTPNEPVGWLIGPEGGFTAAEEEWMRQALGATGVWFGPHILRFETAAVAAALLTLQLRERARLSI